MVEDQRGMDDPFVTLVDARPNSMTVTPHCDIDFILTYGVFAANITTLPPNTPSHSDHLEILIDINLHSFFHHLIVSYRIKFLAPLHQGTNSLLTPI